MTSLMRTMMQAGRVALARALYRTCRSRRTEAYYARALYSRGQFSTRVKGISGRFHMADPGDYEHLVGQFFERDQLADFLAALKPDDVLYEIGGHIGTWSVFLAKRLAQGRLCVFEPEPRNHQRLTANIKLNDLRNVSIHQVAASSADGVANFGVHSRDGDGRHSLIVADVHAKTIEVPTVRLDGAAAKLGLPEPTALKIDCEGAELQVLEGAAQLLKSGRVRAIFIEAHGVQLKQIGKTTDDVARILADAGYRPIKQWSRENEVISIMQRA